MHAKRGDFVEFPSGIEHRFSVDEELYIQAMRLFPGSGDPDWSSVPRSEINGTNLARNNYVANYLCGMDPDVYHDHDEHVHDNEDGGDSIDSGLNMLWWKGSVFALSASIIFSAIVGITSF